MKLTTFALLPPLLKPPLFFQQLNNAKKMNTLLLEPNQSDMTLGEKSREKIKKGIRKKNYVFTAPTVNKVFTEYGIIYVDESEIKNKTKKEICESVEWKLI